MCFGWGASSVMSKRDLERVVGADETLAMEGFRAFSEWS